MKCFLVFKNDNGDEIDEEEIRFSEGYDDPTEGLESVKELWCSFTARSLRAALKSPGVHRRIYPALKQVYDSLL